MANPQHIAWLLEGVESWNKRFLEGNFTPDFEGADIYWEFRKVGKLDNDGMIPLVGVFLGHPYSSHIYETDPLSFYDDIVDPVEETPAYQAWLRSAPPVQFSTEIPSGADFTSKPANLMGANLNMANLAGANLNSVDLSGAQISYANLARADLEYANLTKARLTSSRVSNADFSNADLTSAYLYGALLTDTDFRSANLTKADFRGANLNNANLYGATVVDANFIDANLTGANLGSTEFWKANIYSSYEQTTKQYPGF